MSQPTPSTTHPAGPPPGGSDGMGSMLAEALGDLGEAAYHEYRTWPRNRLLSLWAGAVAIAVAVLIALILIARILTALAHALARGISHGGGWVHHQALTQIVLTPVHTYLNQHAAGLPVDARTLWWTWQAAGIGLFLFSLTASTGGRIGWALYGAATTAMVYSTTTHTPTTHNGAPTAAAITALWWVVLSIPAYRHRAHQADVVLTDRAHLT